MKIKEYVRQLWDNGSTLEVAVVLTQKRFLHSCASRTYVMRIYRGLMMDRAREDRKQEEAKCLSKD